LASYSRCRKNRLALLLERLADAKIRVLRTIPPPPGEPEGVRYEIFHDVLAAAILTWRRRQFVWRRIWQMTRWALAVWVILSILVAIFVIDLQSRKRWQQRAAELETQRQTLVEKGQNLRENAKSILANEKEDPLKNVSVLRNLSLALNLSPQDSEAAKMARNLLLQRVWCPPAASEVRYGRDILLTAAFVPGGSNNEIFAVGGDGQLLFWDGGRSLSRTQSLFEKPKPDNPQQIVQPGFASFSPDGRWLLVIPPTLASAGGGESAVKGAPPQRAPHAPGSAGHEPCKIQIWRWSMQNRTYEPTGEDLVIQRLRGSIINFAWSPESDGVVLIKSRGTNEAECAFFELEGNTFRELVDRSEELNRMKIVALAFATHHSGIAAVSLEPAGPLRKVTLLSFSGDYSQVFPVNGKDSILLPEDFQPNGIAFGPGNDEITLTSWNSVRILSIRDGTVTPIPPPTFRDQFMRLVIGPGDFARRLVAKSLYGRVEVAKGARMQEPAEPVVFRGSIGTAQFSPDGQRLLILSGGIWNVFDSMRLIDVSPLYRTREAASENFEEKPAPPWLADIASAVSALDTSGDGSLLTLEDVRRKYPESKTGDAYESVWKRFFPEERTRH
jgi:hypothetical protein